MESYLKSWSRKKWILWYRQQGGIMEQRDTACVFIFENLKSWSKRFNSRMSVNLPDSWEESLLEMNALQNWIARSMGSSRRVHNRRRRAREGPEGACVLSPPRPGWHMRERRATWRPAVVPSCRRGKVPQVSRTDAAGMFFSCLAEPGVALVRPYGCITLPLWPRIFGMHSTWMQTERNHYWRMQRHVRITNFCCGNWKIAIVVENLTRRRLRGLTMWKDMLKLRWKMLRIGEQKDGAVIQSFKSLLDDHHFKKEELESVGDLPKVRSQIAWNACTWHELVEQTSCGQ